MKHLTQNELIELYYGEGVSAANAHLHACRECSTQYAELKQGLEAIQRPLVPQRSADYGERVWENLRQQLIPYLKKTAGWRQWAQWNTAALAIGCATLLVAGFLGGRYWEWGATHKADVANNPRTAQRVVQVVLTDHLDRTERMLVELEHADLSDPAENMALQTEARELLAVAGVEADRLPVALLEDGSVLERPTMLEAGASYLQRVGNISKVTLWMLYQVTPYVCSFSLQGALCACRE